MRLRLRLFGLLVLSASLCSAQNPSDAQVHQLAHDILEQLVNVKSTESGAGTTPAVELLAKRFHDAGYSNDDVFVGSADARKKNIVVRLRGRSHEKPILLLAHLDVVEANKEDWSPDLDPFKFTERDGYFYGRGTEDVKEGASLLAANMIRWKQANWVPARDIVLALTADEETGDANGVEWLLKEHRNLIDAEYCLNTDGGDFSERQGKPFMATIAAAEKKYSAVKLETNNKGGHGSLPRKDNSIYELAHALTKVEAFQFPVDLNEITRIELTHQASLESGQRAADLKTIVANPNDKAAADRLSEDPRLNAMMRTTCVATEIQGGHAENALPEHVKAVLNCRMLPDARPDDVLNSIRDTIGDNGVQVGWETIDKRQYPASPLRPDLMKTLTQVIQQMWPGTEVMPSMELGASDGKFLRAEGIPTYGVPGVFTEAGDVRAHGKDERIGIREFYAGVDFYDKLMKALLP
jgi:acetylornithine deacetylase/succinyl-diaminopimelate desuccinylase-like protein